jgi:ACR3 family arsenite efflux pump ArsB
VTQEAQECSGVVDRLSLLDRFLPVWIGVAMAVGLLVGRCVPRLDEVLNHVAIDNISLPIALGLLVMMYPVLAKVRYDRLDSVVARPARVSDRIDHRRPRPMRRDGDHLERSRLR